MDDRELENRIKKSAEDLQVKDFSARYQNIQKLADKDGAEEKEPYLVKQEVMQTAGGGGHSVRNRLLVLVLAVILAAAVIFTALYFTVFDKSVSNELSTSGMEEDTAQGVSSSSSGGSALQGEELTEEDFYQRCNEDGIEISQSFKNYDEVKYYITDSHIGVLDRYVTFNYDGYTVTVKFYVDAEYDSSSSYIRESNGVVYVVSGVGKEIAQEILEKL